MKVIVYRPLRRGGAACPNCGAWVTPARTLPPAFGVVIRYHYCKCGVAFKSQERINEL